MTTRRKRRRAPRDPAWCTALATWRATREAFDEHLEAQLYAAERDCRGHLLNRRGLTAGIDARTLFYGPAHRVTLYASEELVEWFRHHGRLTFEQYAAQTYEVHP